MQDGDFLLMDYAPDCGYYMSDVTRMWPVNGKFSTWQRELYGFYLACYREILKAHRPRQDRRAGHRARPARRWTRSSPPRSSRSLAPQGRRGLRRQYKASGESEYPYLGHWVGMATHDVGSHEGPLRPGMVFTIEPALTVPDEKIYVRLEDVVFINEQGRRDRVDRGPVGHRRDREGDEGRGDAGEVPEGVILPSGRSDAVGVILRAEAPEGADSQRRELVRDPSSLRSSG